MALPPSTSDSGNPATPDPKKPAKGNAQQDVFLREVDEALRQDQMAGFFKRYGVPVIAGVVIGLAALGGYLWWDHQQKAAAGERGEQMVVALDSIEAGNLDGANKQLAPLAEAGGNANAVAAKLLRAGIALQQDRTTDAVKIYSEVAADESAPQPYRDLATIREVAASLDTMKPDVAVSRLKPLAQEGSAWFGPAGELLGIVYLKQGKEDLAGPLFAKIARDKDVPDSMRSRARQMAGLLGVDAIDDAELAARGNAPQAPAPTPQQP